MAEREIRRNYKTKEVEAIDPKLKEFFSTILKLSSKSTRSTLELCVAWIEYEANRGDTSFARPFNPDLFSAAVKGEEADATVLAIGLARLLGYRGTVVTLYSSTDSRKILAAFEAIRQRISASKKRSHRAKIKLVAR